MLRLKTFSLFVFVALGLSALLTGCNTTFKPDSITISVANLKAAGVTATETRLVMTLRYTSESLNAFGFSGSTHKLYLNGGYVGRSVSSTPIGLPPLSTTTQDVILIVENAALVQQIMSTGGDPVVRYRLESVLITTAGEDEMKIKSSYEGTIDLRGVQVAK